MPISLARRAGCTDSLPEGLSGTLVNMDRNLSGDSTATSGSAASAGMVSLIVDNSPVTQPAHLGGTGQHNVNGAPSGGGSPSFSYSPASYACQQQQQQSSVCGGGGGAFMYQHRGVEPPHKGVGGPLLPATMMRLGAANSTAVPSLHGHCHLGGPSSHYRTAVPSPRERRLYTDRSEEAELDNMQREEEVAALGEAVLAPPPGFADSGPRVDLMGSSRGHSSRSSGAVSRGHSSQSSGAVSSSSSCTQGGRDSIDSGHVLSDDSTCSARHSAQSSEEDLGLKEACVIDTSAAVVSDASTAVGKNVTPGKNVTQVKHRNTPAKVKAGSKMKGTRVSVKNQKEALHPDIEQILFGQSLGQSQAHSLPLITALCNDLMTGSTHSSTGSYDTSTLRSVESNPDTRRWSTCGPMETSVESGGSCGTMLVVSGAGSVTNTRPYSWHCQDIPLSVLTPHPLSRHNATLPYSQLPLLLQRRLHPHPPPHRGLQKQQETAHSLPHDLCRAAPYPPHPHSVLWTQAVGDSDSGADSAPYGGSLDRYSPELIAQQLMIPSRLNSGGWPVGLTDSGHKLMKENIGIA